MLNWVKDLNRHFTMEKIWMVNVHENILKKEFGNFLNSYTTII